jgi:hypothetical protein
LIDQCDQLNWLYMETVKLLKAKRELKDPLDVRIFSNFL